jgi:hypothetical protein
MDSAFSSLDPILNSFPRRFVKYLFILKAAVVALTRVPDSIFKFKISSLISHLVTFEASFS